jgi:hypothetical protein
VTVPLASSVAGAQGRAVRFTGAGQVDDRLVLALEHNRELIRLACDLQLHAANAGVIAGLFAIAEARGLVTESDWPDIRDRFSGDPEGARRALLP